MNILPGFASIFWFGVLAIIPFAIHFYKKWKRRKVLFAPIFLYKEEMRQAKKSVRLKSNLISILRALVLILLIILLAKPLTSEEYLSWAQNKDKTAVTLVLIDNSKSMDYYTHNETVYQKAIRLTEKLIKELPSDNTILLIELASQLSQPYNVSTDREKLIKRLRFSRVRELNRPLSEDLAELFGQIKKRNIRVKELFLFSDFQRSDWLDVKLPDDVPAVLVKVREDESRNMAITKLFTDDSVHLSSVGGQVSVVVKNFADQKASNYLSFQLGENLVSKVEILLEPGEEKTITSNIKSQTSQWAFGQAKLMYDRYSHDNTQSFEMFFKKSVNIFFLENSDFPLMNYSVKSSILTQFTKYKTRIRFHKKQDYSVGSYDFIICNRLTRLNQEELRLIRQALNSNIPVLFLLNQRDTAYGINRALGLLGLVNKLSVQLFKRYKKGEVLRLYSDIQADLSFHQQFSRMSPSGAIRSLFEMRYRDKEYYPLLKVKNSDFLIQSANPKRNLTVFTGGMNRLNSDILFNQWFPLMLNWVFNEGIRRNLKSQKNLHPNIVKSYVSESNFMGLSHSEIRKISGNDFVTVTEDAANWLKTRTVKDSKSIMDTNTFLEQLFFILILLLVFWELAISYPVHHNLSFKRN